MLNMLNHSDTHCWRTALNVMFTGKDFQCLCRIVPRVGRSLDDDLTVVRCHTLDHKGTVA